jgi:hypothetical protein
MEAKARVRHNRRQAAAFDQWHLLPRLAEERPTPHALGRNYAFKGILGNLGIKFEEIDRASSKASE